jgi:hypothetical protein
MANELEMLFCPSCQREVLAEAPPCPDGHDESCPERACVDCGTALLLDAPLFELVASRVERADTAAGPAGRGAHAA